MKIFFLCIMAVSIFYSNSAVAQINETKLFPADAKSGDNFGYSVASDANYMVIGAAYSDSLGLNSGSAYVYENIAAVWTEKIELVASDGTTGQQFGYSVSVSGDFMLIGAFRDAQNGPQAGAAYIFKRDTITGEWSEKQKLLPGDGSAYDEFGTSVCLRGDYAIIGAPFDHVNSIETGSAYIFKWDGSTWVEEAKIVASNSVGTPQFGISVSIYADYAIVGAWDDETLGSHLGAAYIFHFNGIDWIQQAKLVASSINLNNFFGRSVSMQGDYCVVGSSRADTTSGGAAFIFHRSDTTWTEEAVIVGSSAFIHSRFGESVSLDGDYIVVGAPDDDTNGNQAGCAYIFKRDGINWTEQAMVLASDGSEDDGMGWSVFIEGDRILAGAPLQDAGGLFCGAVYIYDGFVTSLSEPGISNLAFNFSLHQNYPNPFNPVTTIRFELPKSAEVQLIVYDILGRKVSTLVNKKIPPGTHEVEWNAANYTSGLYFYRLTAGEFSEVRKILLVK